MTQNNLGNAFWRQGLRSEGAKATEVLAQAVTAYRCALEVRTREQLPQGWAATQNNLGCALQDQAARIEGPKGAELLAQAVAACRSALEVFTKADQPQDWARTQHNLAAALPQAARPWYRYRPRERSGKQQGRLGAVCGLLLRRCASRVLAGSSTNSRADLGAS